MNKIVIAHGPFYLLKHKCWTTDVEEAVKFKSESLAIAYAKKHIAPLDGLEVRTLQFSYTSVSSIAIQ